MDGLERRQEEVLQLERTFEAPPARVFAAWTDPQLLKRWWGPPGSTVVEVEVDLRVGGRYRLALQVSGQTTYYVTGTYRTIEPPHRLAFTWRWENEEIDEGRSLVTIEFRANEGKTDLRLTHAQLPTEESRQSHAEGWRGILDELDDFLRRQ